MEDTPLIRQWVLRTAIYGLPIRLFIHEAIRFVFGRLHSIGLRIRIGRTRVLASSACGSWKDTLGTKAKFEMVLKGRPSRTDMTGHNCIRLAGFDLAWS